MTARHQDGALPLERDVLETVRRRLMASEQIRDRLPEKGLLSVDRPLPFLFVCRRRPGTADGATERLLVSEAAYLIAPGDRAHHKWVAKLVRHVAQVLAREFGGFLVVEIWSMRGGAGKRPADWEPRFRAVTGKAGPPPGTVARLEKDLRAIKLLRRAALVEPTRMGKIAPHGLPPLLSPSVARSIGAALLGLEVRPVHRDPVSGSDFPLALRGLRRQLSRALKRTVHHYSLACTTHAPVSYLALGRRGFVKTVLEVDRQVSAVSDSFDFLLSVSPVNTDAAWRQFQRDGCKKAPDFTYRPLPADPIVLKRKLLAIPTERIEDPALEDLYREKQLELDRKLTMLLDRSSSRFLYGSLQVYGKPDAAFVSLANEILRRLPMNRRSAGRATVEEFAEAARRELDHYRAQGVACRSRVEIRDDMFAGLLVSQGNLLLGRRTVIPRARVRALIEHEIGTHVLTYLNGRAQPLRILYEGLVGYDELQEGLAVLAEYLVGGLTGTRLRVLAARVVAAGLVAAGASFVDTFRVLHRDHDFPRRSSFDIVARVYRAGGLTKDMVYLRGLIKVLEYLADARNELEPLFVGKIGRRHLPVIRELQLREVLRPAPLRPRYFDDPQAQERLRGLRRGATVLDLVKDL